MAPWRWRHYRTPWQWDVQWRVRPFDHCGFHPQTWSFQTMFSCPTTRKWFKKKSHKNIYKTHNDFCLFKISSKLPYFRGGKKTQIVPKIEVPLPSTYFASLQSVFLQFLQGRRGWNISGNEFKTLTSLLNTSNQGNVCYIFPLQCPYFQLGAWL